MVGNSQETITVLPKAMPEHTGQNKGLKTPIHSLMACTNNSHHTTVLIIKPCWNQKMVHGLAAYVLFYMQAEGFLTRNF